MQIFIATLGVILGFVGLHAHLLGLIAVPHRAFSDRSTDWCTKTCAGKFTYTGLPLSAFLLYRKNIRMAQAGTRRSVRPTLLKINHLCLAGKEPRKSPEKRGAGAQEAWENA